MLKHLSMCAVFVLGFVLLLTAGPAEVGQRAAARKRRAARRAVVPEPRPVPGGAADPAQATHLAERHAEGLLLGQHYVGVSAGRPESFSRLPICL